MVIGSKLFGCTRNETIFCLKRESTVGLAISRKWTGFLFISTTNYCSHNITRSTQNVWYHKKGILMPLILYWFETFYSDANKNGNTKLTAIPPLKVSE